MSRSDAAMVCMSIASCSNTLAHESMVFATVCGVAIQAEPLEQAQPLKNES